MIQPPTDNLYKFMAIFGLILFLAGTLYPAKKLEDATRRIGDMNYLISQEQLSFKKQELKEKLARLENDLKNMEVDSKKKQLEKGLQFLENENPDVARAIQEVGTEIEILLGYLVFGILSTITGIVLMFFGFRLWYTRLQKHLDAQFLTGGSSISEIAEIPTKHKPDIIVEEGAPPTSSVP